MTITAPAPPEGPATPVVLAPSKHPPPPLPLVPSCGWAAIAPFKHQLAVPAARAVLAGMILLPCATLTIHVTLSITCWKTTVLTSAAVISASMAAGLVCDFRGFFGRIGEVTALTAV